MNYKADLPSGRKLLIINEDGQTRLAISSDGDGHQQSSANSFSTGDWKQSPTLFKTAKALVLQIEAEGSQFFFQVEDDAIHRLDAAPSLDDAEKLTLQEASQSDVEGAESKPMKPMEPMKPIEPMKPME
jgi:hypothetical protein